VKARRIFRPDFDARLLFERERAHDFGGRAEHERAGRDFLSAGDERAGADDRAGADLRAVQHDGAHADEHFVGDGAGVEDGLVADGDEFADEDAVIVGEMNDRPSCTLERGPMTMRLMSPRRTVWNQTLDSSASVTSPTRSAPGATKAVG
jgi:hypothetical protein